MTGDLIFLFLLDILSLKQVLGSYRSIFIRSSFNNLCKL